MFPFCVLLFALVYYDAAPLDCSSNTCVISVPELVVINDLACGFVPDFDSEPVHSSAAVHLAVNSCQHKPIVAFAVDGS